MPDFHESPSPPYSGQESSAVSESSFKKGPANEGGKGVKAGKGFGKADSALRSMPLNADAERAALSCMLLDPSEIIPKAIEKMSNQFFYVPAHRIIYETLLDLYKNRPGGTMDLVVLTTELSNKEQLEAVGGAAALAELLSDVPTTALFEDYAGFLKEKFVLRRVIQDCTECVTGAYDGPENVPDFLDSVEKRVLKIRNETEQEKGIEDMKVHVLSVIQQIQDAYEGNGEAGGLMTGFDDIDKMTNGLHGGEMIVVAARPSMGKTSFVMNIVENMAIDTENPTPVAVFSLEMSSQSLVQRVLCSRAKVPMQKLRGGFLAKSDLPKLMDAAGKLAQAPIWIDDTPGITINELQAKARRLHAEHGIRMIAIDYLQLLKAPDTAGRDGREKEVAEISGGIKNIAKELNIPVIVLAQLNRNPDGRGGKPRMSDLRESGAIEQDADLVGLLMRPEVYADDEEDRESKFGEAEFIIAKQRNGPTGDVPLTFQKEFMRFETRAHNDED
jgi:replicative DNA helicase